MQAICQAKKINQLSAKIEVFTKAYFIPTKTTTRLKKLFLLDLTCNIRALTKHNDVSDF